MLFLGEIKRRKVFQVAAIYAFTAWLIIQIIDVVNEPLSLPEWLDPQGEKNSDTELL